MRDRDYIKYLKEKFPDAEEGTSVKFQGWAIGESIWLLLPSGWEKIEIRTIPDNRR